METSLGRPSLRREDTGLSIGGGEEGADIRRGGSGSEIHLLQEQKSVELMTDWICMEGARKGEAKAKITPRILPGANCTSGHLLKTAS